MCMFDTQSAEKARTGIHVHRDSKLFLGLDLVVIEVKSDETQGTVACSRRVAEFERDREFLA